MLGVPQHRKWTKRPAKWYESFWKSPKYIKENNHE